MNAELTGVEALLNSGCLALIQSVPVPVLQTVSALSACNRLLRNTRATWAHIVESVAAHSPLMQGTLVAISLFQVSVHHTVPVSSHRTGCKLESGRLEGRKTGKGGSSSPPSATVALATCGTAHKLGEISSLKLLALVVFVVHLRGTQGVAGCVLHVRSWASTTGCAAMRDH